MRRSLACRNSGKSLTIVQGMIAASCTIRLRRREYARAPRPYPGVYTEGGYGHVAGRPLIISPHLCVYDLLICPFLCCVVCAVCMLCRAVPVPWGGPLGYGGLVTVGCHNWCPLTITNPSIEPRTCSVIIITNNHQYHYHHHQRVHQLSPTTL